MTSLYSKIIRSSDLLALIFGSEFIFGCKIGVEMASAGEAESDAMLSGVEGDEPTLIVMKNLSQEDVSVEKFRELLVDLDRHARRRRIRNRSCRLWLRRRSRCFFSLGIIIAFGRQRDEAVREKEEALRSRLDPSTIHSVTQFSDLIRSEFVLGLTGRLRLPVDANMAPMERSRSCHRRKKSVKDEFPKSAWLVSKMGRLTAGVQYEPQYGSKERANYKNLMNWSCAIGYGVGSGSPLSPSFNFGLELAKSSQPLEIVLLARQPLDLAFMLRILEKPAIKELIQICNAYTKQGAPSRGPRLVTWKCIWLQSELLALL
ncbi:Beta-galactosidase 9 isoform 2, partial [Fagus crenata]